MLDPPRAGIHKSVIGAIREYYSIKKLIYVSCSPESASSNWHDLCVPSSKRFPGVPFRLSRAMPVDMFPQTNHCEMVLEFTRE